MLLGVHRVILLTIRSHGVSLLRQTKHCAQEMVDWKNFSTLRHKLRKCSESVSRRSIT